MRWQLRGTNKTGLPGWAAVGLAASFLISGCGDDGPSSVRVTTGTLAIDVVGLPAEADALIEVSSSELSTFAVHGDTLLQGLPPGTYSVTAHANVMGAFEYDAETATQSATVGPGLAPLVRVAYFGRAARGQLLIRVEGLPVGASAALTVSGPDGFERAVTDTDTLRGLSAGSYTVRATAIEHASAQFFPTPEVEEVLVTAGGEAGVFVTYSELEPGAVDLQVVGIELVQAVQRAEGTVPLIRDRPALVRVHAVASQSFSPPPPVRVEFTVQDDLVWSQTLGSDANAVSTEIDRGDLRSSWNVMVPGEVIQPGLQVRATIDPAGAVLESNETNNRFPNDGTRLSIDVVSMGALPMRLVPVATTATGLTGNVDAANADDFVSMAAEIFPFTDVAAETRAPFTSDAPALQATNGNGGWYDVLRDVLNLRTADGGSAFYYYGVVQVDYGSGVAGMGFVSHSRGGGPNTAIGWDRSGTRAGVLAHELGHNLGRSHAACGGPVDTDPGYPYPNARTGQWGFDSRVQRLVDPAAVYDIMSYCRPQWISDYNFEEILEFAALPVARNDQGEQNCVLVSGRVDAGAVVLDPVVQMVTRPRVPAQRGAFEVSATDATGRQVLAVSFDPESIGCGESDAPEVFSWALPINPGTGSSLARVELNGPGIRAVQDARTALDRGTSALPFGLYRVNAAQMRLEWDAALHPLVLVRDADRNETVAMARRGAVIFPTNASRLEVVLSDGARSITHLVELD